MLHVTFQLQCKGSCLFPNMQVIHGRIVQNATENVPMYMQGQIWYKNRQATQSTSRLTKSLQKTIYHPLNSYCFLRNPYKKNSIANTRKVFRVDIATFAFNEASNLWCLPIILKILLAKILLFSLLQSGLDFREDYSQLINSISSCCALHLLRVFSLITI